MEQKDVLINRANTIINETQYFANDGPRVGGLIKDVVEYADNISQGQVSLGTVSNLTALNAIVNPAKGDRYIVSDQINPTNSLPYYYVWSGSAWVNTGETILNADAATKTDLTLKASRTETFNVSQYNNKYDYASQDAARNAVPSTLRALGQQITYNLSSGKWVTEQYIGTNVSGWATSDNWKYLNSKTIFTSFTDTKLELSGLRFYITEIACGYLNRNAYFRDSEVAIAVGYDCVIAELKVNTGNVFSTLYSGKALYPNINWWQINDLPANRIILAVKSDKSIWSSPYPEIQSLIDKIYINDKVSGAINGISGSYPSTSFIAGQYLKASNVTTVSVGDTVSIFYTTATDAFTLKIPVNAKTPVNIYTHQGAFTPAFIVDANNVVLEVFGAKTDYLDTPLKIVPNYTGYLIVNAHEVAGAMISKMKVSVGMLNLENRLTAVENEANIITPTIIEKVVKKGGTIGTDCDFVDIKAAINSITDNSKSKQYILHVLNGDYDYSNDGDLIGVYIKNYVTLHCQSKNVRIIKRDTAFNWGKATIDVYSENIEYTAIKGAATIISNNCKCPIHIDSANFTGIFEAENLDLINEQPIGTGDNPSDGQANCFAVGWRGNEHFKLSNIRANGKIWGHNYTNTKSKGIFELIGANCRTIQIGDLTSYGNDKVVLKGCKADLYEHLWFSEFTGNRAYQRQSFAFEISGNNIAQSVVADHAGTHDALTQYFNGIYPFTISNLHKIMNGTGITVGSLVKQTGINTVSKWQTGDKLFGIALENSNSNGRTLIQYSGIASMSADASNPIAFNDELEINSSGNVVKRTTGILIGFAMSPLATGTGIIKVKMI